MILPPDDGRRRPLVVRYSLGNVRSRTGARRLTVVTVGFVVIAVALQDPVLVAVAAIGLAAFLWSIRWMDRHDAWEAAVEPTADAGGSADVGDAAPSGERALPALADAFDATARPLAIESLRTASFGDAADVAVIPAPAGLAAKVFAALIVVASVTLLGALVALESAGGAPSGSHVVEIVLDALMAIGFGVFGVVVSLGRRRLPGPRVLNVIASVGLGLVAGLGYFIAGSGLAAVNPTGPGTLAAWLIGAAAAGAGVWLTATSGGRLGLVLALPAVLIGWYLGLAAWIAHIRSV